MDRLLASDEEPAVEVRDGGGPLLIACEHASNRLPRALGTLGLSGPDLERHIAWDPGAAELSRRVAERLDATLVLQRYSRLALLRTVKDLAAWTERLTEAIRESWGVVELASASAGAAA